MNNFATLFLNAPLPPKKKLDELLPLIKKSYVVCADGGYLFAKKIGIEIKAIIGDLDTIEKSNILLPNNIQIIKLPSQEKNDFEKALLYLKKMNYKKILLFGATGGRTDHVLANLSVIRRYIKYFEFQIFGEEAAIVYLNKKNKSIKIKTYEGQQVSLIPLSFASGIVTKGLKYHFKTQSSKWGQNVGSSNEAIQSEISVSINSGNLLILVNY